MINSGLRKLIEENALALATVDKDNKPHCIAVGFAKVVEEDQILITNNCMVDTISNIKNNPNISLTVWTRNWEDFCEGYELKGTAEYFEDGAWVDEIKKLPENEGEPCRGALVITVTDRKKLA